MKTLFRVLGAAAAVAVTGAAIVVLDKVLNDKDPLHVENVEFPEEAEKDPAKETAPGDAWPPAFEKAPAEPETAPAAPVVEAARAEETAEEKPAAEETTVNPVEAGPAVAPKDENGKFDTTKIAEASDFTGIEEESGCKS